MTFEELKDKALNDRLAAEKLDVTMPGKAAKMGHKFTDGEGKASRRKVRVCKECGATIE